MTLTAEELRDNYFFACSVIAGPPYKYSRTDFKVRDDGNSSMPSPYISQWNVPDVVQPTDLGIKETVSMVQIAAVAASITFM